ncbi:MAG TPA: penicillin-binding protein [Bacteroidota bacterium]|nr:penicillin-binding protein [Bacteroidota bacterium]
MTERPAYHAGNDENPRTAGPERIRLRVLQIGLLVLFAVVGLRLLQIQVIQSSKYREIAQKQYREPLVLPAARGMLLDRNNVPIASNSMFISFAADPKLAADDARTIAAEFSRVFGKPRDFYLGKLQSESRFVWLERQVSLETARRIDVRKLPGIVVRNEPKRLYYHGNIGGQLIGCTNIDNDGIAGLELEFDRDLRGVDGYVIFQRDGLGHARPSVDYPRVEPVNGCNVVLTVDMGLQAIAEKELKKGIEASKAERGIVVMLQPKTGDILAIAQYPAIDPNSYGKYPPEDQRLRAVTDNFEPGSVFKIVTTSAALDNKLVTPDQKFFAENGVYNVRYGSVVRPITDTHKEGIITFQQALEVSSNIVMAKVSDIIGSERLYKMARDYGFGIPTDVGFPGEIAGVLKKPKDWSLMTLNSVAYGYEVSVSPIQIATAYAAVANGGILMKPHLLKSVVTEQGQVMRTEQPQVIRRVVSEETAKRLTDFFEGVVLRGTAKMAAIPGIRIAGKTGTSRKMINGHYDLGSYTASFVGFVPADDPAVVCLVMMDNPQGVFYTGGTTSAPVFRDIIQRSMTSSDLFAPAGTQPAVVAERTNGGSRTMPEPVDSAEAASVVIHAGGTVPDVRGFSIRRAVALLIREKLDPVVTGSGIVVRQSPEAGAAVKPGTKITLTCQPKISDALSSN